MPKRKILVVDDEVVFCDGLVERLSDLADEFEAVAAYTGVNAVKVTQGERIDLVILDIGLPDLDGTEVARILRRNGFSAPVIMLTGHDADVETIRGLESGANDYVAKPFRFAVLLARIRAQLRQDEAREDTVLTIGRYTFHPASKLLVGPKGATIPLTEKEARTLRYLHRAGEKLVSRESLLQEVWDYRPDIETHTIETHIYRLRQKIEQDAEHPSILVTEAGGYKLITK